MLNQLENLTARVGGSNTLVDSWLNTRRQLLIAYYRLVGLKPKKSAHSAIDEKALDDFCQGTVDYLSACHFSLYERIIREMEGTSTAKSVAQIYPRLEANTQSIMHFYDTSLETAIDHDNWQEFQQALSGIGEALEARFTLEDKLLTLVWKNDLQNTEPDNAESRPA
ncbi:sigma D regulator [Mangrovibacter sp. SLW1]